MTWNEILKIILVTLGGIGSMAMMPQMNQAAETSTPWDIILQIAPLAISVLGGIFGYWVTKRQKKYEERLNEQLATLRHSLDKKQYISKVRFDTEFAIYRELLPAFWNMVYSAMYLFPKEAPVEQVREKQNKIEDAMNKDIREATSNAIIILNRNCAFIDENVYNTFLKLVKLCEEQHMYFERYVLSLHELDHSETKRNQKKQEYEAEEGYKARYTRTDNIHSEMKQLTNKLRTYLAKLDVIAKEEASGD
ncbi:MAG: hypothetical protein LBM74_03730 [Oscillospiraceae bacterium]|jgi:hypothetical protein|nr:hypothetical protein [Oscillospiraceae bacterium]